jgi:dTDP-glucose 4,6-dehydratase
MRILVTGGAGFLGSHLCELFLARGDTVVCLDDLSSGRRSNIRHLTDSSRFSFVEACVLDPIDVEGAFEGVVHLAGVAAALSVEADLHPAHRSGGAQCARIRPREISRSSWRRPASLRRPLIHPQSRPIGASSIRPGPQWYDEAATRRR